jgi:MFS family permease
MTALPRSLEPLRDRSFRMLFFGRTLSNAGDALVPVALAFAVLELGDATDLGLVLGAGWAMRVVFLVVGGVWADRLPRQLVMMAADVVRATAHALVAAAFFTDAIAVWHLAASSAAFGIASAFFNPASTGLVPSLVSPGRLQEANALLGFARSVTEVGGPLAAGLLVTTLGFGLVFAIDAASFVASFACLAAMRLPAAIQRVGRRSMLTEALEGLRVIRERRWIVIGLSCDLVFNLALGAYFVLGPLVVERHFGGAPAWGVMMTAAAVGGLAGNAVALRYKPQRPLLVAYAVSFVTPLQLLALAGPAPLPALTLGAALVVVAIVIMNTFWATMEQQHVPQAVLSRVDALAWMVSLVAMPAGMVVVGPLSEAIGVSATLVGAAAVGGAALAAALAARSVRDLRRKDLVSEELVADPVAAGAAGSSH